MYENCKQYLALNSDYPLSVLYNDRNLLKKLVEDQERDPTVSMIGRTAVVHDTVVRLDDIGDMYRSLLKEMSELEHEITQGLSDTDGRFRLGLPSLPTDEPNNSYTDFFFGDVAKNGFTGAGDLMLDVLVDHERFAGQYVFDTGNGGISFNPAACHELLQRFAQLRALLFSAVHISSGSPGRGSELLSQHLRNAPGGDVRNVKLICGRICFVGGYNKTTHQVRENPHRPDQPPRCQRTAADVRCSQTERHKVMYRFPPHDLAPYLLREWLVYRPVQVQFARMLGMESAAHRLRYLLFPGLYSSLSSADLTDMLRASTRVHLGYEIGLHDWRDVETAFVQNFYDRVQGMFVAPAHYAQRGHSLRIGNEYYGTALDSPAGVPHQVIRSHLEASEFWQDLTSERPVSPPLPDHSLTPALRRYTEAPGGGTRGPRVVRVSGEPDGQAGQPNGGDGGRDDGGAKGHSLDGETGDLCVEPGRPVGTSSAGQPIPSYVWDLPPPVEPPEASKVHEGRAGRVHLPRTGPGSGRRSRRHPARVPRRPHGHG